MRSTDKMLADTSGPAHKLNFISVYENRKGELKITPGYTKSLSEDAYRVEGITGRQAWSRGHRNLLLLVL